MKIGVKFCGNCNSRFNARAIVEEILGGLPEAVWLPADSPEKDVLLVISGCTVDCATRPLWSGATIVVAGETVDSQVCSNTELPKAVSSKLEVIRDELARNI